MLEDKVALDQIAELLRTPHWDVGLLNDLAYVVSATGRDTFSELEDENV